jgi:hypothetical protein
MKRSQTWFLAFSLVGACSADQPVTETATVNGVVEVDNAIENATVFLDYNHNNLLDAGEPRVATDATGHFTLSWDNPGPEYADTIGAIIDPTSTRVGMTGDAAAIGLALHMRAPLGDTSGAYDGAVAISPLTTLVVSELASDPTLTQAAAEAKIAGAVSGSHLPFTPGEAVDVMGDYAGTQTSADSVQLRYVAGAVGAAVASAVTEGNSLQSTVDCNDAMFFNAAIVALDHQLTAIANGTYAFSQLTRTQQQDVAQNPANYNGYFIDTAQLADDIEAELLAAGEDLAEALFEEFKDQFVDELEQVVADLALELIEEGIEAVI